MRWFMAVWMLGTGCAEEPVHICAGVGYGSAASGSFATAVNPSEVATAELCWQPYGAANPTCTNGQFVGRSAVLAGPLSGEVGIRTTMVRTFVEIRIELPQELTYDDRDGWRLTLRDAAQQQLDGRALPVEYRREMDCDGTEVVSASLGSAR